MAVNLPNQIRYLVRQLGYILRRVASLRGRHLVYFLLLSTFLFLCVIYGILNHLHYGDMGRWYWNWEVSFHPIIAYIVPPAWWSRSIDWEPTYFQEINDAPYMGTFHLPELSQPTWGNVTQHHGYWYHDTHPLVGQTPPLREDLTSPVILKLHVFTSSAHKGKREKRDLIRKVDPRLRLPKAYRHLVELKFVMGHAYKEDWAVDEETEMALEEEQRQHGDLLRLPHLFHGENLREGKILDWIEYVGSGQDGGRKGWYLFKMDDDTVVDLPFFLDTLLAQDPRQPIYLGTSLARWPAYHFHFTGMLTGFSYSLYKTLTAGIGRMSRKQIENQHDDDVLTGEVMFGLPSGPQCRPPHHPLAQPYRYNDSDSLPAYCDPHHPPPWGWLPPPPSPDPRTGLIRYDYLGWMGDPSFPFTRHSKVCTHGWAWKPLDPYERESLRRAEAGLWKVPKWLEQFADPDVD